MIKAIAKLIIALNGNVKSSQIASGFAWGVLLGLAPGGSFFWIVLFVCSFFFRHHHGGKLLSMTIIKLFSPVFIYQIDALGWYILNLESLHAFFTALYNMPFVPFTKFNNTLVMGGTVMGLILWLPSCILFMIIVPLYRRNIAPKIRESKLVKKIVKFPFLSMIDKAIREN